MLQSNLQAQTKSILNSNGYNTVRRLGKGGFGHVLLATKSTSSTTFYAVKCISKKKMIKNPQLKRFLVQEINTMALLNHVNIVRLLKTFQQGDWYFLVLEYCDVGNLYSFVSRLPQKTLALEDALLVFRQILRGLEQIHSNNIIHRDIKLENILLRKNNKGQYICKIGDFGLARPIDSGQTAVTNCGTQIYMAPEILNRQSYGKQADIWSMGVLLYYLLFSQFPFKGINILDEIKQRCLGGFKLNNVHHVRGIKSTKQQLLLCQFFQRIFEIQPQKRITISELFLHGLMREDDCNMTIESPNTTATEQQEQSILKWECARVQFVQRIVEKVVSYNFLSFWLTNAFKFYINKILLHFFNRAQIRLLRQGGSSEAEQQLNLLQINIINQLHLQHSWLLKNNYQKQNIDRFEDGFNLNVEEFIHFKMAYRNTVGKVYEEVHRKLADNLQDRAALKLKLFLCHILNRVFSGCVNSAVFPFYLAWVKKHNKKISNRYYDFRSIEEWISEQRPDNLQRSQDTINQVFYK